MEPKTYLGLFAATCTTISFFPQTIKIIKSKHTKDISLSMYLLLVIGLFSWLLYGISLNDLPMIVANSIATTMSLIILFLKIKYK